MSLARPWWLAALVLLLPLIALHLRRPSLAAREVPSLDVWERVAGATQSTRRRFRRPREPLLLALQALALCAFALALAGPQRGAAQPPATTVYVVDGSLWMHVGNRLGDARASVLRLAAAEPQARVVVVSATGTPAVTYRGAASGLAAGLRLKADAGAGDLPAAVTLGAGLLEGAGGRMVVLRAPEDVLPRIDSAPGQLRTQVVGSPADEQGLFARGVRCGVGPAAACEVVATVRNGSATRRVDRYAAYVDGKRRTTLGVAVPAHGTSTIVLTAPAGSDVRLQLVQRDALRLDDAAWFAVPNAAGIPAPTTVTLVGDPATAKPLAQALAAAPDVELQLRTPASYRRADALKSDLVVLDRFVPRDGLPPAPAVVLIAPPRLPGGAIGGAIAAPTVSGAATGSDLLAGVDLRSLSVDRGAASRLLLPSWMSPVVWTPSGPLLAAGDDGRRRVAVLAFDPPRSNLTQLPAFPILARNLERWASGWAGIGADDSLAIGAVPGATAATVARATGAARRVALGTLPAGVTGVAPGPYAVTATGRGVRHTRALTAGLAAPAPAAGAIDVASWARAASPRAPSSLTPWLIALGLAAVGAEWLVWRRLRR